MLCFPNAKINLGLRVLRKRSDGFHDIETIFYPIRLCDALEIIESIHDVPLPGFNLTGLEIKHHGYGKPIHEDNLVIKVFRMLQSDFGLPPVYIHLHKAIPAGAGLGGGSSDAAFALKLLNQIFNLRLSLQQQSEYLNQIGSDCAFFLHNKPALASGKGDALCPIELDLTRFWILIVKPEIHINTGEAYSWIKPRETGVSLSEIITRPVHEWKQHLINDFEVPVFQKYSVLSQLKTEIYKAGASYAAMSGSGSAIFGIFDHRPAKLSLPATYFQWVGML